ncbi:class Ib ribonucleoside-diphosphate reductase assembly flavoprotein NrdI [Staphylococcus saprophyticus]|uniref:class Ib ribonucleoside-diphosphate reductase assembly flavoprotein NrdI n=1 Tax=Staphylococcus saprophyticus TaxID=29385 RepID=UPI0024C451A0|nr:class Ib ribonucleoside-diphosphate reductase assembly flavoprotein NrdI [Staphylococcus saprophyticus]MDK1672792.1 class Ib ribonucleoside-diphosphate reductase assembly flavoprotein NrdI [Staphylococcus saprophyticus]
MANQISIVYFTKTRQTEAFVNKFKDLISNSIIKIEDGLVMDNPYILLTSTYGFGNVPEEVEEFLKLEKNKQQLIAVMSSGNKNWGSERFANSGNIISKQFGVDLIGKYEQAGTQKDVEKLVSYIENLRQ